MWTKELLAKHNMVELTTDNDFVIELMYSTKDNMFNEAVYNTVGQPNQCVVHTDVKQKLEKIRPILQQHGLKMKICDAYRHPKAHERARELVPIQGFLSQKAENSLHCRSGAAIDVTLLDAKTGQELEFPTLVDAYAPELRDDLLAGNEAPFYEHLKKAAYDYEGEHTKNRDFLRKIMEEAGFLINTSEWWHFQLEAWNAEPRKYPAIELPL